MSERILVFIPAYQCAAQIGRVLAQFRQIPAGVFSEILVLDNRSVDDTIAAATRAMAQVSCCRVQVARNLNNYNLGGSHKAAFAYAREAGFSHVVVLHGDDQGRIDDLLPLLARGEHRRHAACLGARFMRGSRLIGYSHLRILGNHAFNALFTLVSGARVLDLGSGLNVFSRTIIDDEAVMRYSDDLRFNVYLLLDCIDKKKKLHFFPISWREDDQISNVKMFSQARKTLAIALQYWFKRAAFRTRDHRSKAHASYRFEIVASNAPALDTPAAPPAAAARSSFVVGGTARG